ncbi:MAG: energy-coupling factor ABC transporter ATP-binding protein [Candidatus Marinarcus sp.]|uniref:energy-coupling factor ABC transporter ATP-binding protein n=1 Tax=Candidatus Marinarcus sp. TaxID=3100987 RepID=UPI003AFFF107
MSCSLNFREVEYACEDKTLFSNVVLNVGHEEKVAIIGPNGCGKSTLLKIAAGLICPTAGFVEIFHNKINDLKDFKSHRANIGYLPQDVSNHFLCPTVIEDVIFALRAKGESKEDSIEKGMMLLDELGILHLRDRIIFELSGGEQKIVALAGLLILEPKILLLDEPTNALDEEAEAKIITILNRLKKSMIIVSHHKSFIESLTPTIYKLNALGLTKVQ